MICRQLYDRASCTYTYLIADAGEAALIDPVKEQVPLYLQLLGELGLPLRCALDTHVHADHLTALGVLRDETGCETRMGVECHAACVSRPFADGDDIPVGGACLTAMYTPGHTDDSYCFVLPDRVFTGDTLLIRGTGRTDFQNGDARAQYRSITERLLTLPDETLVYPGHDYRGHTVSTIGEERAHNPRLQVEDADAYAELMAGLDLPSPKLMDVAVPANRHCGFTP